VTVNDAAGPATTTGIDISSTSSDGISAIADVTKFTTDIPSHGSDITLTFSVVFGPDTPVAEKFFVMNGFELVTEPATIVLLGLDSLALIRRRRS